MNSLYCVLLCCFLYSIYIYDSITKLFRSSIQFVSNYSFLIRDFSLYKFREMFVSVFESGKLESNDRTQVVELTYYKDSTKYKIAIPVKRGLRPIKTIAFNSGSDEENKKDIETIKEFMGPYGNFHGIPTKPNMMGITRPLIITYRNNSVVKYESEEIIELYPLKIII
jgi:hypothetical protein